MKKSSNYSEKSRFPPINQEIMRKNKAVLSESSSTKLPMLCPPKRIVTEADSLPNPPKILQKSNSQDAFSTPARRRRLIGDISKFLLSQYYLKGCTNVCRFRIQTRSSIVIQCAFRCFISFRCLMELKILKQIKSAVTIQMYWRSYDAKCMLEYLRHQYRIKMQTILAIMMQCMHRKRKAVLELKNRKLQYLVLQRLRNQNALLIQTHSRIYLAKRIFIKKHKKRLFYQSRLQNASIRIQCFVRKYIARCKLVQLRLQYQHKVKMANRIIHYWRKFDLNRCKMSIKIQKHIRGKLHRLRYRTLMEIKRKNEMEKRSRRQECDFMYKEDMYSSHMRAVTLCDTYAIEYKIYLTYKQLYVLRTMKVWDVIKWCINHKLLYYGKYFGYDIGILLHEIMNKMNNNISMDDVTKCHNSSHTHMERGNASDVSLPSTPPHPSSAVAAPAMSITLSQKELSTFVASHIPMVWDCPQYWSTSLWWTAASEDTRYTEELEASNQSNLREMSPRSLAENDSTNQFILLETLMNGDICIRLHPDLSQYVQTVKTAESKSANTFRGCMVNADMQESLSKMARNYRILLSCSDFNGALHEEDENKNINRCFQQLDTPYNLTENLCDLLAGDAETSSGLGFQFKNISVKVTLISNSNEETEKDVLPKSGMDTNKDLPLNTIVPSTENMTSVNSYITDTALQACAVEYMSQSGVENLSVSSSYASKSKRPQSAKFSRPATATKRVVIVSREEEERLAREVVARLKMAELYRCAMARRIQRKYRDFTSRRLVRVLCATKIILFYKRYSTMLKWHKTALQVIQCIRNVTSICQRYCRKVIALKRVQATRQALSRTRRSKNAVIYNQQILQELYGIVDVSNEQHHNSLPSSENILHEIRYLEKKSWHLTSLCKSSNSQGFNVSRISDEQWLLSVVDIPPPPSFCVAIGDILLVDIATMSTNPSEVDGRREESSTSTAGTSFPLSLGTVLPSSQDMLYGSSLKSNEVSPIEISEVHSRMVQNVEWM